MYDFYRDTLSSTILPMANCHISLGYCTSQTMTVVWDVTGKGDCPVTTSLGKQEIRLYYNSSSLYRIEMPALGISIHRWKRCSERARHCFPSNLFCTINGFYISSSKCRDLANLTSYPLPSSSHRPSLSKQYPEPKLAAFITEVEDQMAEFAYSLEKQNRLLHCQLERSLGIIANTVGRLFPTEILSLAKGKPTFGIASGDVITELSCRKIIERVLPSLAFDNGQKFSLLPLVDIGPDHAGNPRSGQLVSPNFVIQGKPTYYESYHSGRALIFRVNSRYILYENYTATHFNLPVSLLHVTLTTIDDNFTAKDFSFLHQKFAETQNGLTDLHSLLSAISQTAVDRDQIKQAISMLKSSENDDADMTEVSQELQTFAYQSLLLALSEISSPIITLFFFILQILGSIWALFFTIKFLKNDAPKLLRKIKTAAVTWIQQRKIKTKSRQSANELPLDDDDDCNENMDVMKVSQPQPTPRRRSIERSSFDCDVCGESSFCGGRLSLDCEVCDKFSTSVESEGSFFCSSIMCALSVSLVLIVNGTFTSFLPSDVSFLEVIS